MKKVFIHMHTVDQGHLSPKKLKCFWCTSNIATLFYYSNSVMKTYIANYGTLDAM